MLPIQIGLFLTSNKAITTGIPITSFDIPACQQGFKAIFKQKTKQKNQTGVLLKGGKKKEKTFQLQIRHSYFPS